MTRKLHVHKYSWGDKLWGYLHTICIVYGLKKDVELQSKEIIQIIYALPTVIPCEFCSNHFMRLLAEQPPDDALDAMSLFKWSVDIHNKVNAYLGKPILSYGDAVNIWTKQIDIDDAVMF